MFERKVLKIEKNSRGEITALINPFEYWSPRRRNDAISDLETKLYRYYIESKVNGKVYFEVIEDRGGKDLRTASPNYLNLDTQSARPHIVS